MTRTYLPDLPDDVPREQPTFQVGDEVYIATKPPADNSPPWCDDTMDVTVGMTGVVEVAGDNPSVRIGGNVNRAFFYPPHTLVVIKRGKRAVCESDSEHPAFKHRECAAKTIAPGSTCIVRYRRLVGGVLEDKHDYLFSLKSWVAKNSWIVLAYAGRTGEEQMGWIDEAYEYTNTRVKLKTLYGTREETPDWANAREAFQRKQADSGITLKDGGKYCLRNGCETTVSSDRDQVTREVIFYAPYFGYYDANGKYRGYSEHEYDIVAEVMDIPAPPPLPPPLTYNDHTWDEVKYVPSNHAADVTKAWSAQLFHDAYQGSSFTRDFADEVADYSAAIDAKHNSFAITPTKESNMTIKIEKRTYINGSNATDYTDDMIFNKIAELEKEIDRLRAIKNPPRALKARIVELEAGVVGLGEIVDARMPAPVEATAA